MSALERENLVLRPQLEHLRANPPEMPSYACDNSCVCARPEGMAPNGGCRCEVQKLRMMVQFWRAPAQHRLAVIELLRLELAQASHG